MNKKTLILGIGNYLLRDEGIGIHIIHILEKERLPSHISLLDGGTSGLHLLSWLQDYERIILIDATLDNNPPGTIQLIYPHHAKDFPPLMSAHEIGLQDMIEAMILTEHLPEIQLITISVQKINDIGLDLTPSIKASIPKVIHLIKQLVDDKSHKKKLSTVK